MRFNRPLLLALAPLAAACSPAPIEVATLGTDALTNGLIAHWPLDEGNGASVSDHSGNGHNGVLAGNGWSWVTGQFGEAIHLAGSDSVAVSDFPAATSSYSVSAWVLIASSELGPPIGNLISTEVPGGGWALYATLSPGSLSYVFRYAGSAPGQYWVTSCNCLQPDTWTHVTGVMDADAGTLSLYVGTALANTIAVTGGILPGSTTLYLGRSAALQPLFPVSGMLDDVAIYNRPLSPEEIAALGSAPAPDPQ